MSKQGQCKIETSKYKSMNCTHFSGQQNLHMFALSDKKYTKIRNVLESEGLTLDHEELKRVQSVLNYM